MIVGPQGLVAGIGALYNSQPGRWDKNGRPQDLMGTEIGEVNHGLAPGGGQQHLLQEALVIHIFPGGLQPLRRALIGLEEEVIHVEHPAGQLRL